MKNIAAILLTVLATSLAACSITPVPIPDPIAEGKLSPEIKPETRVVDDLSRGLLKSYKVLSGELGQTRVLELRFSGSTPFLSRLQAGNVLVSEQTPAAPYGYLIKVTSSTQQAGETVVLGEDAKLTDAVAQGEISFDQALKPDKLVSTQALTPGAEIRTSRNPKLSEGINYDYTISLDKVIYDNDNNLATTDDQVGTKGSISFNLDAGVTLKLTYKWLVIPNGVYFRAGVGVDQKFDRHTTIF